MQEFDVTVIGSGPGGYVCAIRAAQLGLKVAIIEKDQLGGICLNWGCIPTKALLKSAEVLRKAKHAKDFGISITGKIEADIDTMMKRSRQISQTLSSGVTGLMAKNKIKVISGVAKIKDKNTIIINNKDVIKSNNIVVATGARPRDIKDFEADGVDVWNYKHALSANAIPESLTVIGGGAIGVEFASFYSSIGSKVTLLEAAERILPVEDNDISEHMKKSLEKDGITIFTGIKLNGLKKEKNKNTINFLDSDGKTHNLLSIKIIVAAGIIPNTENIAEITIDKDQRNCIVTNKYCQTNHSNIYAIGDVTQAPWLAHKASHEGIIAAEHIASSLKKYDIKKIHPIKKEMIPSCTYAQPNVASIGLTESEAKNKHGNKIKVGKFPFFANGKAVATSDTDGFVKVIFADNGEILGAHIIGQEATELIHTFSIAKSSELVEDDIINTIFAHPTIGESIHEVVMSAFGRMIHF